MIVVASMTFKLYAMSVLACTFKYSDIERIRDCQQAKFERFYSKYNKPKTKVKKPQISTIVSICDEEPKPPVCHL